YQELFSQNGIDGFGYFYGFTTLYSLKQRNMMKCVKWSVALLLAAGFSINSYSQTATVPNGWYLKDKTTDGYYGISLDKAYDFVKGKKSTPVVVAVIDSGVDTTHEDLKSVLWTNTKEIPGN